MNESKSRAECSNGSVSSEDELVDVVEYVVDQLSNLPSDRVEAAKKKRRLIDEFSDAVAEFESENVGVNTERWISAVSESDRSLTKTEIKDAIESKLVEKEQEKSSRKTLDGFLEENVEQVVEVRTTDRKQDTVWRWELGETAIETSAGKDGMEHMNFHRLRDAVYEATGVWCEIPSEGRRGGREWKEYIVGFIQRLGKCETTRGQRTIAVDNLKDWIRQNNAYVDLLDTIERGGCRIDEECGEIHIENQYVKRWCDSVEISTRAFQCELDSRGLLADRISGASERTNIEIDDQYRTITYWVIDLDKLEVDPYQIIEEPKTAAEKEAEEDDGRQDDKEDDGGQEVDDGNENTPGVIDSIGGGVTAGGDDE